MTPTSPCNFTLSFFLCLSLAFTALVEAAVPSLALVSDRKRVTIGDVVEVSVTVDSRGQRITSAGFHLFYDTDVFCIVPAAVVDGIRQPFLTGSFLRGVVYDNRVRDMENEETEVLLSQASLHYVGVTGTVAGRRDAAEGRGEIARFALQVMGKSDSGEGFVLLHPAGPWRSTYTIESEPGIEHQFAFANLVVEIAPYGMVPLSDVKMAAGSVQLIDLSPHYLPPPGEDFGDIADVKWELPDGSPSGTFITTSAQTLAIEVFPESVGSRQVAYCVAHVETSWCGEFELDIQPLVEPVPLTGDVEVGEAGERAPAVPPKGNPSPILNVVDTLYMAPGIKRTLEDIGDIVSDFDHNTDELVVISSESSNVSAWLERNRLVVEGLSLGRGSVVLTATDPSGKTATHVIDVVVTQGSILTLTELPSPRLITGEVYHLSLNDYTTGDIVHVEVDMDTPGIVEAEIHDLEILLYGVNPGRTRIDVVVTDSRENQASSSLIVTVDPSDVVAVVSDAANVQGENSSDFEVTEADEEVLGGSEPRSGGSSTIIPEPAHEKNPLSVLPIPGVRMKPGESVHFQLHARTETAQVDDLIWSVAGVTFLHVELESQSGVVSINAPSGIVGTEILLFRGQGRDGGSVSTVVEVQVTDSADLDGIRLRPDLRPLALTVGEPTIVSLSELVEISADLKNLTWTIRTSEHIEPAIIDGLLILRADRVVDESIVITAEDQQGNASSVLLPITATAVGEDRDSWTLTSGQNVELLAGFTEHAVALEDFVEGVEASAITWSLVAVAGLRARIEASSGILLLSAVPESATGRYDLVLEAALGDVRQQLQISVVISEGSVLRLVDPEAVSILVGQVDSSLVLSQLVDGAVTPELVWTVRGGGLVQARIDSDTRLWLDTSKAQPGREVFELTATTPSHQQTLHLQVNLRAPLLQLLPIPDLAWSEKERKQGLDLDRFVAGDFSPDQITWTWIAPEGVEVRWSSENGRLLEVSSTGQGVYTVVLTARPPTGAPVTAILSVVGTLRSGEDTSARVEPGHTQKRESANSPSVAISGETLPESPPSTDPKPLTLSMIPTLLHGQIALSLQVDPSDKSPDFDFFLDGELVPWTSVAEGIVLLNTEAGQTIQGRAGVRAEARIATGQQAVAETWFSAGILGDSGAAELASVDGAIIVRNASHNLVTVMIQAASRSSYNIIVDGWEEAPLDLVWQLPDGSDIVRLEYSQEFGAWQPLETYSSPTGEAVYASFTGSGRYRLTEANANQGPPPDLAFPNPFNETTAIRFFKPEDGDVEVRIVDVNGHLVKTVDRRARRAGMWTVIWDGRTADGGRAGSGIYFFQVLSHTGVRSGKMMLLK